MPLNLPRVPNDDVEITKENFRHPSHDWMRFFYNLINALNNRIPVTGTVTFAAATSAAVTFTTAETSANYKIFYDSPEDAHLWTTNKTTTGFTANTFNATSSTFGWQLIRP